MTLSRLRGEVIERVQAYLRRRGPSVLHVGPLAEAGALAERLCALAGPSFEVALLATSDGDAFDNALKLARAATGRSPLLACPGPRRASSLGALSLGGAASGATIEGCRVVAPADLEKELSSSGAAALVIAPLDEALRPRPGVLLRHAEALCKQAGALLIVDETASGLGRCGEVFLFQKAGLHPDAVVVGQSLGAGAMAIAATVTTGEAHARAFGGPNTFDLHTATMAGNAAACEAALGFLDVLEREGLPGRAARAGELLRAELRRALGGDASIEGAGLLLAVAGRVLTPPLDATDDELRALAATIAA